MSSLSAIALRALVDASAEPMLLFRTQQADWPVVMANPAFAKLGVGPGEADGDVSPEVELQPPPFAEIIDKLVGRESALEVSEAVRSGRANSISVNVNGRECLLILRPVDDPGDSGGQYMAVLLRFTDGRAGPDADHALKRARHRIRDLRREDPLTGLLNERTFRDILTHDWAVAAREQSTLAVVAFTFDDFPAYVEVFGRHAADSCLRRVGQTVQRCLRRASDVVGRQGDDRIVVLSHAADEDNVRAFAERIATAVRELRIHHPRSEHGRFVTVSHALRSMTVSRGAPSAEEFLDELLGE